MRKPFDWLDDDEEEDAPVDFDDVPGYEQEFLEDCRREEEERVMRAGGERAAHLACAPGWMVWVGGGRPTHLMPCGLDQRGVGCAQQHVDAADCWCEPVPTPSAGCGGDLLGRPLWRHEAADGRPG